MRKLFLTLVAAMAMTAAHAIPAIPTPLTYTQSDGTSITVQLVGDEWYSTFATTDGLLLDRRANGDFYYKTAVATSNVMAHNVNERTQAELTYIKANEALMQVNGTEVAAQRDQAVQAVRKAPIRKATQTPQKGSPKIPVILVNFSDFSMRSSNPATTLNNQYNSTTAASVYKYFNDQSQGKFTPQFDVIGPVTLPNTRAYYGAKTSSNNDAKPGSMVAEAVKLCTDTDFSQYDNNGDGDVDVVIIVYAGPGQAQGATSDAIWPHQWNLYSAYYSGCSDYSYFKQNGVTVNAYACFNETSGSSDTSTTLDGIGTFCHEFSHCLGLPDFYETTYSNGYYGMGRWSLMCSGSYNNNSKTPMGYLAYEKEFMGWISIPTATVNTQYTLNGNTQSSDFAVRVYNPKSTNEYYILENIQKTGWNAYAQSSGLMVNHVTYSASAWNNNTVNNSATQRMTIIPADNTLTRASEYGDLYPYGGNNMLTDASTPAATLNEGSQQYMGKPITEITNSNGKVTFWFCKNFVKNLPTVNAVTEANTFIDNFTVTWNAVDNALTYAIEITDPDGNVVASGEGLEVLTYTASHLEANTTYTVKVNVTYNDATTSDWTSPITVTTKANPVMLAADEAQVTTNSFLAQWQALPNVESYTLHVRRLGLQNYTDLLHETFSKCTKVATTNIGTSLASYTDNAGWTGSYVYQNVGGVSLASASKTGTITTPALDFSGYEGKVVVKVVAAVNGSDTGYSLVVTGDGGSSTITVADNVATEYTAVLNTNGSTEGKVTLTALPGKKVIVYDVKVYGGDAEDMMSQAAPRKAVAVTGDSDDMTITGITTNQYSLTDLVSGAGYQYRVKAFYTNGCETTWSNVEQVQLVQSGLTGDVNGDGTVDIDDVNAVINIILGATAIDAADVNGDGTIDIDDVNTIINIILS